MCKAERRAASLARSIPGHLCHQRTGATMRSLPGQVAWSQPGENSGRVQYLVHLPDEPSDIKLQVRQTPDERLDDGSDAQRPHCDYDQSRELTDGQPGNADAGEGQAHQAREDETSQTRGPRFPGRPDRPS